MGDRGVDAQQQVERGHRRRGRGIVDEPRREVVKAVQRRFLGALSDLQADERPGEYVGKARDDRRRQRAAAVVGVGLVASPDDPDARPRRQGGRHRGERIRLGGEPADGSWYRVGRRREHARQAHLVDPEIVGGKARALVHRRVQARRAAQQWDQRRIAGKRHSPAAGRDQREIAAELDGVAEALLGLNQHVEAIHRLAVPNAAGQVDEVAAEAVVTLAPFVFAKPSGVVAGEQRRGREVPVRLGEIRRLGDRRLAGGARPRPAGPTRSARSRGSPAPPAVSGRGGWRCECSVPPPPADRGRRRRCRD